MTMSELPEDLIEEILCRVPTTSLKQLRSTCKQWNRLIDDRRFTTKHFDKAPKQFQSLMLKQSRVCLMRINIRRFSPLKIKREATLTDPHSRVDQIQILEVSHCDGLLLCYTNTSRLVVWNPCTGQTRWIQTRNRYEPCCSSYALGSYQDKKSNGNSYKILRQKRQYFYEIDKQEFEIYEINSNSWRVLDVTIDFELESISWGVSLKGKTYWIATDKIESDRFIISFDYSAERFERLCLPRQYDFCEIMSLSVVREEKLAMLLQPQFRETEIWVTNKISGTKPVSWSKALAVKIVPYIHHTCMGGTFVFDDEKKVLTVCEMYRLHDQKITSVYIVGEDSSVRKVELETLSTGWPFIFNYVPSLIQLQQGFGGKRKRGK